MALRPADASWPGGSGEAITIKGAKRNLSGATWNPQNESLWVARQEGQIWRFDWKPDSKSFELVHMLKLPSQAGDDIEAIAQVDSSADGELFTLSEDEGRVAKVVGLKLEGTPQVEQSWNLEVKNNGHSLPPETSAGDGAEALEFVPDDALLANDFRFPDGSAFDGSKTGMGGLIFVGHQVEGRLHVFDLNPNISNDFINHGSFLTSAEEIAGLHFDRTSGHMLIWHNPPPGDNSLEISTLSSTESLGTVDSLKIYESAMPTGNLEGIAIVDRTGCGKFGAGLLERALFLTHDAPSNAPKLVVFKTFPCDCTGSSNQTDFDRCAARKDLSSGCACLDLDDDGDVDCDDFNPPISPQCIAQGL